MRLTSLDRMVIGFALTIPVFIVSVTLMVHLQVRYTPARMFGVIVFSVAAAQGLMYSGLLLARGWRWTRRLGRPGLR